MNIIVVVLQCLLFATFAICHSASEIPPIRHYDFVTSQVDYNLDSIHLHVKAFNQTYTLKLSKNDNLILRDSVLHLHDTNTGQKTKHTIVAHPYKGHIYDDISGLEIGWARILFHSDPYKSQPNKKLLFDGSFNHPNGLFHINTVDNYRASRRQGLDIDLVSPLSRESKHRTAHMVLFKDVHNSPRLHQTPSHMQPRPMSSYGCGFQPSEANDNAIKESKRQIASPSGHLRKRQAGVATCFTNKRVLPMGAAADCSYTSNFGSAEATLNRILSDWNQASQVYENTFNIQLALIEVKILQGCGDQNGESLAWNRLCTDDYTINDRLSHFSQWRGTKSEDQVGLWHLMTKCNTGPSVGVAWLNMLCEKNSFPQRQGGQEQFVSGTGVSSIVPTEWKVVAHEIGHNFGSIHDCISMQCPTVCEGTVDATCQCCPCGSGSSCDCDGQFLMHPTDNSKQDVFSGCSIQYMCAGITASTTNCLVEPGSLRTISSGICGNGVTEGDEDCDCGAACDNNPCCDGETCTFKDGAQCDDSSDDCCQNCQLRPAGTTCRDSFDVCTFTQVCDGVSGVCPNSVTEPDGSSCTIPNGTDTTCASGVCTSRQLQCQSLVTTGIYQTVGPCPGQDNQCSLLCATSSGVCLSLNGNFIDGTPCAAGGACKEGRCQGGDFWGTIMYYFESQPQLAWPVAIALGILALSILCCCAKSLFRCCTRQNRKSTSSRPGPSSTTVAGRSQGNSRTNYYAPTTNTSNNQRSSSIQNNNASTRPNNWVDPAAYNGPLYSESSDQGIPPTLVPQQQQRFSQRNSLASRPQVTPEPHNSAVNNAVPYQSQDIPHNGPEGQNHFTSWRPPISGAQ